MRHLIVCLLAFSLNPPAIGQDRPDARPDDDRTVLQVEVEVAGSDQVRGETPATIDLDGRALAPGPYNLVSPGGATVPAVIWLEHGRPKLGFVLPSERASTYRLAVRRDEPAADGARGVVLRAEGRRVAVELDGQPWTRYVPDDGPKPYLDPLIGPGGATMTRGWPMRDVAGEPRDHPHHRSLWFAHLDVNHVNTWDERPGHGQIRAVEPATLLGGGPVGVLETRDDWLDRDGGKVCEDERVVRFYATRVARVFDFEVTLKATAGPVRIGDNKDGVFAIRLAAPMAVSARQGGQILNSRGERDGNAWGRPAEWVDYTGPVAGRTMGVAILNHPTSFRYPTHWHVRDYGLFAANPFGWRDFGLPVVGDHALAPGESIRLAYRVILHDGTTAAAGIEPAFHDYAHPPRIKVR